ncbi:MAG: aminotransferase class V-fold PLP-dependent enzyme [Desulfopila sp.]
MSKLSIECEEILAQYDLTPVINVSGTMTSLGASLATPQAIAAAAAMQNVFVRIDELQARSSKVIAAATGAEAGFVTACSAAGITVSIAACMTGTRLAKIEQLPDTDGLKNEVVVQRGHLINYGAPIDQAIRLAGARVVGVGTAAQAHLFHLEDCINENTAAALFVVSHHTVQEGQIPLADFIKCCRRRGVPVIVDMASEYDLRTPTAMGSELVIYSSHKFLSGPTAGIVAGKKELIRAAYLQNRGIGRTMKIGKEGIVGAMAALEAWAARNHEAERLKEAAYLEFWRQSLAKVPGLILEIHPDWTHNPIDRLKITVVPAIAGLYAWELADRLAAADPAVYVRDDLIEHGYFFLDPCNLKPGEEKIVSNLIASTVFEALSHKDGCRVDYSERRQRASESILQWLEH